MYVKLSPAGASAPIPGQNVAFELKKPLDLYTDQELAEHQYARLRIEAYPQDGYRYELGAPYEAAGVWKCDWVQQPTPDRDSNLERLSKQRRDDRNALIATTDWTQLADAPLTAEQKAAWVQYRQALRDLPNQPNFPWVVNQPVKPA